MAEQNEIEMADSDENNEVFLQSRMHQCEQIMPQRTARPNIVPNEAQVDGHSDLENIVSRVPVNDISQHGSTIFQPSNEFGERQRLSNQVQREYSERSSCNMSGETNFQNEDQTCALDLSISKVNSDFVSTENESKNRNVDHGVDKYNTTTNILQNSIYVHDIDQPSSSYDTKSNISPVIHPSYSNKKPLTCQTCNKKYTTNQNLKRHMLTHNKDGKFLCRICNKRYAREDYFKKHMLIHYDKGLFSCNFCNKQFTCQGNLDRHLLIHSGKKPFSCSNCNKQFTQKAHLQTHILIHTGEKSYKCTICQRSFRLKSNFTKHLLTHRK